MPIYEYQCAKCGEVFEVFQRINDEPVHSCKFCRGTVEKLISHTSFQLKGSGWYLTDYAHKSQPSENRSESTDSSKSPESKSGDGGSSGTLPKAPAGAAPPKSSE